MSAVGSVNHQSVFYTLLTVVIFVTFVWYIQYHWKRRKLYRAASKVNGPPTFPLVGNAVAFVRANGDWLNSTLLLIKDFDTPTRLWLGQKLYFAVWDLKNVETILNSSHALKKDALYRFCESVVGTGLFTAPVSKWRRHKKIILPTFNQRIMNNFVDIFTEQADVLVKQLEKEVGNGFFDVCHYLNKYSLDVICETVMGVPSSAQTTDSNYFNCVSKVLEVISKRPYNPFYHFDFIFSFTPLGKEMSKATKSVHAFSDYVIKEKRTAYQQKLKAKKEGPGDEFVEEFTKGKTLLQKLIELSEEGARFTDEELREEVDTFMIAGSDTTATVISFALMMLGMHPHIQEKVHEEIINVLGPDKAVDWKDLPKFEYLERVIKETLRLFPVGSIIAREVDKDMELDGCTVPEGSSVLVVIIKLHRSEKYWRDPLKFDPDRFLPEEVANRHPYSWLPFSGGLRNCVGPKYAMMEMKALLATVIRRYRLSTEYRSVADIKLKADIVLKAADGFSLSVQYREP